MIEQVFFEELMSQPPASMADTDVLLNTLYLSFKNNSTFLTKDKMENAVTKVKGQFMTGPVFDLCTKISMDLKC